MRTLRSAILLPSIAIALGTTNGVPASAQTANPPSRTSSVSVPPVIRLSNTLKEYDGSPRATITGVTFSIFNQAEGGNAIWSETQEVHPDKNGNFTVFLGAASNKGLPLGLFSSGEARWIQINTEGIPTPPRSALVSVAYALKAGDSATLGGRPASDFALRVAAPMDKGAEFVLPPVQLPIQRPNSGKPQRAAAFESTAVAGPSFISNAMSGSPLVVQSSTLVSNLNADLLHGFSDSSFAKLAFPNIFSVQQSLSGGATMSASVQEPNVPGSFDSAPLDFESAANSPSTLSSIKRTFRWSASPVSTTNAIATAQLSLSFGVGAQSPLPTGLSINSDGTLTFAPNQQFPSAAIVAAASSASNSSGTSATSAPVIYAAEYQWSQQPTSRGSQGNPQGIQPGLNNVQLTPCPFGVSGQDAWHYLYVSGTGTPEVVLISGGTCTSGATTGTAQFMAVNSHAPGFTIGTATAGLQEAINAAVITNTWGGQAWAQTGRNVLINPGTFLMMARLSIRVSDIHILGYGATVTCAMTDTCIMLGDPSDTNMFGRIVLEGLTVRPGVQNGTYSAIEDNANGSQMRSIGVAWGGTGTSFGHLVQVDNDQAASMDRIDVGKLPVIRCDSQFCGSAIFAPGPFATNAAVGWITNSNLDGQCAGNGVDWQSGKPLC